MTIILKLGVKMKKVLVGLAVLLIMIGFSGCVSSGYSLGDYKNAYIAKDGVYKFNNPRMLDSNLLVKISTYTDKKNGSLKKKIMMLTVNKNSDISNFKENDKNVITWPFYNIYKNKV